MVRTPARSAIRVLPPEVAARIAAGEVIERPASVVKELVENALDAGASRIAVEVTGGGLDSVLVSDDGCGIEPEELPTAFQRHATSKLDPSTAPGGALRTGSEACELPRVLTLGFRGEALPSIAAVADVEMVSRPPARESGAYVRLAPESPPESGARGAPAGTTVTVRHLFARLPARRKFLRSPASESAAIAAVVTHCALAYPEVRFTLTVDGRESLRTPGSGDLRDAVSAAYGAELAAAMLEVRSAPPSEGGDIAVSGLAAPPHISRAGRGYVSLFVNRRWVANRRLLFAVEEAYRGMLMTGRHPLAVLGVSLPYEEVDVNVHPAKAEVRFRDESAVFAALQRAVRQALRDLAPVPAAGPGAPLAALAWTPPLWRHGLRVAAGDGGDPQAAPAPGDEVPPAPPTPAQALPVLRVLGQLGGTYIIAEGPDGMYLIDQHAAHERVLYEAFRRAREVRRPEAQALLEPLPVEVSAPQRALLAGQAEPLREHGFDIEPFGGSAYVVRSLPRPLAGGDVRENVARFLEVMVEESGGGPDPVAMSLACHGAIRAGKTLAAEEMRELVRRLEESESPQTCPHGRPTMLHMSVELLAREFGRR